MARQHTFLHSLFYPKLAGTFSYFNTNCELKSFYTICISLHQSKAHLFTLNRQNSLFEKKKTRKHKACIRWTGKVLGANPVRVFMSGDLGGKQSHAFPQKTIQMNWIELKTSYFCKISLPYPLKLTKYQVLTPKSTFIERNLSKTLKKCWKSFN